MMRPRFSMPVILVKDIRISRDFYQDIFDLEIEHDFGENISFACGLSLWERSRAHEIIFQGRSGYPEKDPPKDTELYFETDDIEEFQDHLKDRGVDLIHPLKVESWGQRSIRFFDPDGFIVEVGEPIEVFVRRLGETGLTIEEVSRRSQISTDAIRSILEQR